MRLSVVYFVFFGYCLDRLDSVYAYSNVRTKHNDGSCQISGVTSTEWENGKVLPSRLQNDTIHYEFKFIGSLEITENCHRFMIATVNDDKLILDGTPDVANIDMMVPPTTNLEISCFLLLKCASKQITLIFIQPIKDLNTHPPTFYNSTYDITIPSWSLKPGVDIAQYLRVPIHVEDADFSNRNVTFTVEPDDFDTNTTVIDTDFKRIYIPILRVKNAMNLSATKKYFLTATDSGTIPKQLSSKIEVTVQVSNQTEPSLLHFSKPIYKYYYYSDISTLTSNDSIILLSDNDNYVVLLDGDDNVKSFFSIRSDSEVKLLEIGLSEALPTEILKKYEKIYLNIVARGLSYNLQDSSEIIIKIVK